MGLRDPGKRYPPGACLFPSGAGLMTPIKILRDPLLQQTICGFCQPSAVRHLRQSRRLERLEPLKAVGLVTLVLNADLRGQKPMRRFRSRGASAPRGRSRRHCGNALFLITSISLPHGACHSAAAEISIAPLGFCRRTRRLSALLSAYLSVSKCRAVKLYESPGRAVDLPIESPQAKLSLQTENGFHLAQVFPHPGAGGSRCFCRAFVLCCGTRIQHPIDQKPQLKGGRTYKRTGCKDCQA